MADDPTEEVIKREIAKARRIIQEDKHALGLKGLSERFDKHYPDNSDGGGNDPPSAPPSVPPKETPKRKGIWWGTDVE